MPRWWRADGDLIDEGAALEVNAAREADHRSIGGALRNVFRRKGKEKTAHIQP